MKTSRLPLIFLSTALLTYSGMSWSEEFYRWHDNTGVAHYGYKPPQGVDATKVKVYGSRSPSRRNTVTQPQAFAANNNAQTSAKAQPELQREQQSQCAAERKRLATLQANRPIRMKQSDGSLKYLSREEIAREIQQSNSYLSDACK